MELRYVGKTWRSIMKFWLNMITIAKYLIKNVPGGIIIIN